MRLDRRLPPLQRCDSVRATLPRACLATLVRGAGLRVGSGYAHLCAAGSGPVEGGAMWVAPLVAGGLVLFARRVWLGSLAAVLLVLAVGVLRDPYLEWVHRP